MHCQRIQLNEQVLLLESEIATLQTTQEKAINTLDSSITTTSNIESISLSDLYDGVVNSVITIECTILEYRIPFDQQKTSEVQGSGFIYEYEGQLIVVTNNHVVEDADSIAVTFADENTYDAEVIGADVYTDLPYYLWMYHTANIIRWK
jgi:S1-C subfamily serine protease